MIKLFIALLLSLFLYPKALAGEMIVNYGLGLFLPTNYTAEIKLFSLGYKHEIGGNDSIFSYKFEGGLWADDRSDLGRLSSGFISGSLGVEVHPGVLYLGSYWGIAGITTTDSALSTNFEFTQDLLLGIEDSKGRGVGLDYKHFSNAGIALPNLGRDFLTINVKFPIGF